MRTTPLARLLRVLIGIAGALALLGGVLAFATRPGLGALWLFVTGAVLLIVAVYEEARYRTRAGRADRFQRTDEVFRDPTSGELTRVWIDPTTGERDYRPEL
ncbi:MAG TPA: hypothetical protein VFW86_02125 [Candidatus Limnocylindrales bacterium]|nr:hypothetical protein [Candidatus Limnocylindrales bacterium]